MKKRLLILSLFVLILLSPLFSRPQFFFGGGVEWGKLYMDESEMTILKGNTRYSNPKDGAYISHFVPTLEATFIPVADIGVGIICNFGYGGVLGYNNGSKLYSSSDNGYSIFTDSIVDASIGVRYMTVMAKEIYLSFTSSNFSSKALSFWARAAQERSMSVTFSSPLNLFPGAETTTIVRSLSLSRIALTFLIWEASATLLPPNLHTFIDSPHFKGECSRKIKTTEGVKEPLLVL